MFEALAQGASHPAVAAWLGLGTAAVAAVVVAMAWSVNARQIRLAELLARAAVPAHQRKRPGQGGRARDRGCRGDRGSVTGQARCRRGRGPGLRAAKVPPEVIDGPDQVVAGEQARYRVQTGGPHQVVSWAVGGAARCRTGPTRVIPVTCCLSPSSRAT